MEKNGIDWPPFAWTLASMFCGGSIAGALVDDSLWMRFWAVTLVCLAIFCGITAMRYERR